MSNTCIFIPKEIVRVLTPSLHRPEGCSPSAVCCLNFPCNNLSCNDFKKQREVLLLCVYVCKDILY